MDGYPRNLNQGLLFEQKFGEIYLILLFDVQKEVLLERMHKRGRLA